jgi:hypothetical protein
MKAVYLKVDDNGLDTLLTIIKNLKNDLVKEISVKDIDSFLIPTVSDAENQYYSDLLKNMSVDDKTVVSEKSFTI